MLTPASFLKKDFSLGLFFLWLIQTEKAPGQNRTDANSLEGYRSTIELQARYDYSFTRFSIFSPREKLCFLKKVKKTHSNPSIPSTSEEEIFSEYELAPCFF